MVEIAPLSLTANENAAASRQATPPSIFAPVQFIFPFWIYAWGLEMKRALPRAFSHGAGVEEGDIGGRWEGGDFSTARDATGDCGAGVRRIRASEAQDGRVGSRFAAELAVRILEIEPRVGRFRACRAARAAATEAKRRPLWRYF